MRKIKLAILILSSVFVFNSCCFEDIVDSLKDSFEFKLTDEKGKIKECCQNGEKIIIKFEFLKNLPSDVKKEYTLVEIKNCIIDNLIPTADIHLVIRQYDNIIEEISLNYKNSEAYFEKQVRETSELDPWLFKVPYLIPMDVKEGLTAQVRVKYTQDDEVKYIYSEPLAIPICGKISPPIEPKKAEPIPTVSGYDDINITIRMGRDINLNVDGTETKGSISGVEIKAKDMIEICSSGRILFDNAQFIIPELMSESSNSTRSFENDVVKSLITAIRSVNNKYHYIFIQGSADGNVQNPSAIIRTVNNFNNNEKMIYNQPIYYLLKSGNKLSTNIYNYQLTSGGVSNNDLPNLRASFVQDILSKFSGIGTNSGIPIGVINGEIIPGENVYNRTVAIYILETEKPIYNDNLELKKVFK